ncbi:Holliday junction resolvase RuvX [Microcella daejeonensis]|uniref:Putative pre-16S rRNA nuclease n=1 Tax=Microcella daejeonensis TaxID=2994971 RepID=A0A9E8MKG2_9MICO|nr:Holliday junction resolvase RuvX [Microcella daejeonensis]WAB81183.1 Holliday junction resolvase RuvX [Microcella daejeonensis]WAB83349.1 Holliday junction resolvase RuvX [Microcella daejeonensis]
MRLGVRLGVDVGTARVGVARCDAHGILATPVETLPRKKGMMAGIHRLVAEWEPIEIVVGLPLALSGSETASTQDARDVAALIARQVAVPVRLVDERLTTVTAARSLRESGRDGRTSRSVIDQAAAVILLQHALDHEKSRGEAPGELLVPDGGSP